MLFLFLTRPLFGHHMITQGAVHYGGIMLSCNFYNPDFHWVKEEQLMCSLHGVYMYLFKIKIKIISNYL